ncbi:MAG: amidase, partial [Pseudomonadota bacterium]
RGLKPIDAYMLCSVTADMRITQLVNGNKGVHCVMPKTALA